MKDIAIKNRISFRCPQTHEIALRKVLFELHFRPEGRTKEDLMNSTKIKKGYINGTISVLEKLGYVESTGYRGRIKKLTGGGKEVIKFLKENEVEELKAFSERSIKKIELLVTAKDILHEKGNIPQFELGKAMAKEHDLEWNDPATYRMVARSCRETLFLLGHTEHGRPKKGGKPKKISAKDIRQKSLIKPRIENGQGELWYYVTQIYANPDTWYNEISKDKLLEIIRKMKEQHKGLVTILLNSMERNILMGFEKRDSDCIREGIKMYLDYLDSIKS